MDDFENGELGVETSQEILLHLEGCPQCAGLVEHNRSLRSLVSESWFSQPIPDSLRGDVLDQIARPRFRLSWLAPIAAGVVIMALFYAGSQLHSGLSDLRFPGTDFSASSLFSGHAADDIVQAHKECEGTETLDAQLLPVEPVMLRGHLDTFDVVTAHQCVSNGRTIFHFVLAGSGEEFSLIFEETAGIPQTAAFSTLPGARRVHQLSTHQVWRAERGDASILYLNSDRFQIYLVGAESTRVERLMKKLIVPLGDLLA